MGTREELLRLAYLKLAPEHRRGFAGRRSRGCRRKGWPFASRCQDLDIRTRGPWPWDPLRETLRGLVDNTVKRYAELATGDRLVVREMGRQGLIIKPIWQDWSWSPQRLAGLLCLGFACQLRDE